MKPILKSIVNYLWRQFHTSDYDQAGLIKNIHLNDKSERISLEIYPLFRKKVSFFAPKYEYYLRERNLSNNFYTFTLIKVDENTEKIEFRNKTYDVIFFTKSFDDIFILDNNSGYEYLAELCNDQYCISWRLFQNLKNEKYFAQPRGRSMVIPLIRESYHGSLSIGDIVYLEGLDIDFEIRRPIKEDTRFELQ